MGVAIDYMNDQNSINSTRDIFIHHNTFSQCGMTNMLQVVVTLEYKVLFCWDNKKDVAIIV